MASLRKTENLIIFLLWIGSLSTYTVALLSNYVLYNSDYCGLIGLTVVTLISILKPELTLKSLLVLLLLGVFNLVSFVYFFNLVFTFGFHVWVTPGIQFISLLLLGVLFLKKGNKIGEIYRNFMGTSEQDLEQNKINEKNYFKTKFESLSDNEIDRQLENDLVLSALEALKEIKEERKTHYNKL